MSNYLSLLILFVLPATLGAAVYRDFKSEMYTLLYAYPITKPAYLAAKFLAAYLVTAAVVLMIGLGFMLGTQMPGVNQEVLLPFALGAYTQLFAVYILPNMLLFGVLVFGRRGSHAKARAASGVGQEIVVQSQAGYFVVQQLDLYRVEHADLEGQRFVSCFFGSIKKVCFITQSTEPLTLSILLPNRKCRLFSAW